MPLPFKVESLDSVPESARELYTKDGDGFSLSVEGLPEPEDTSGLKSTLAKQKRRIAELEAKAGKVTEEDLEELEQLRAAARQKEEDEAKKAGKWDELRAKLQAEHDKKIEALTKQLTDRDADIERLVVKNELRSALAQAGVKPEYQRAVELMLLEEGRPKVHREDGKEPFGVFPDELHGDKRITDFVKEWAKSEAASPYMPPENGAGGGGHGHDAGGGGKRASWEGKKWSELTMDEKVAKNEARAQEGAAA